MRYIKLYEEFEDINLRLSGFNHDEQVIKYDVIYHTTSISNLDNILKNGLNANKPSDTEPHAIYLTPDIYGALILSKSLSKVKKHKFDYVILEIKSINLHLYKDPYAVKESGVYTYDKISSDLINVKTIVDNDILKNNSNWKIFWNWWFWNKGDKPEFIKKFNLPTYTNISSNHPIK